LGAAWPDHANRERDFRVILSYGVWKDSFGGRDDVVGRKITLDHAPGYVIHGVAGRGFDFPRGIQVYRSVGGFTSYDKRDSRNAVAIARIRRPYALARLQAELDSVSHRLAQQYPDTNLGISFRALSFRELYSGDVKPYLLVLLGAVGFVLLIACGNVVNLLLSRALSRDREMAVRIALGASRSHILGQLLTESALLSLGAAGFGLGLAYWWMKLLRALIGVELPQWMVIELDGRVLAFTLAVSVIAGLISGLAPALQLSRPSVAESLQESGRGSSSGRRVGRLRDCLVVAEIALAVVLLTGGAC
jgi:putative ABC transport system permease protein